jgi:hypothetical protein
MQILNAACDTKVAKDLAGLVQSYTDFMQLEGLKEMVMVY